MARWEGVFGFTGRLKCNDPRFQLDIQSNSTSFSSLLEQLSKSLHAAVKAFIVIDKGGSSSRIDSPVSLQAFISRESPEMKPS
jgi:hypothetical protein